LIKKIGKLQQKI